ncbi:MAG: glycosyltransferase [Rhodospirillaceae bacterium]
MNVVFVNYHHFASNSAIHIFNLANRLAAHGIGCAVAVPDGVATVTTLGKPAFQALTYEDARAGRFAFPDGGPPTLVHAWTPREGVRQLTEDLVRRWRCPYTVHLEDNEELIAAQQLGTTTHDLAALPPHELDRLIGPGLSHPHRYKAFLAGAAGVTVIIDRLFEFKPPAVPGEIIWPSYDDDLFVPQRADPELRRRLGLGEADKVIVYPGNVHAANLAEMKSLYLAVDVLNRRGLKLKLVRIGEDYADPLEGELADVKAHIVFAGRRPHTEIAKYLALADVLVQPGRSDPFNDYRFPSKLPEFFAMGRPVILPAANVGAVVRDGEEGIVLREGHALEIADAVSRVLGDADLADRLGRGARAFAERALSWEKSADMLRRFWERVTSRLTRADDATTLAAAVKRYAGYRAPAIGYATVRDYCDSADHLPVLAKANMDMKDVQRAWTFKMVVGNVPPGGKLLEIGAGTPIVADLLTRAGYEVWVLDPYDGRDGGPAAYAYFRATFPRVHLVRGLFPDALTAEMPQKFDGIYSISVLEHVPPDALAPLFGAIGRHLAPGGSSIHAVDHVYLGNGDADHLDRLRRMVVGMGRDPAELDAVLAQVAGDPDAYFLSAEAHNAWRGATDYAAFPMRRCISVQLFHQAPG